MELEGAHDQPDSLPSYYRFLVRSSASGLPTNYDSRTSIPSNALALHLVLRLPSHDVMWLSDCLSFTYGYAARFHLPSSHVLVLLFLYRSYIPLLFACGLSGPHPLTCNPATWPVFVITGHIMQ